MICLVRIQTTVTIACDGLGRRISVRRTALMNSSHAFVIAIIVPIAFLAWMLAMHQLRRVIPPYRQALRDATDRVPKLTNRKVRWIDVVGRDDDRLFLHVSFADATTLGQKLVRQDRISYTPSPSGPSMLSQLPMFARIVQDVVVLNIDTNAFMMVIDFHTSSQRQAYRVVPRGDGTSLPSEPD